MLFLTCGVLFLAYVLLILWKRRHIYKLHGYLKNEFWSFPILGHSLQFLGDDEDRMKSLQKFGKIAMKQGITSFWLGPKYYAMVADADIAETLLKKHLEKDGNTDIVHELLGDGSIFAPVHIWRTRRKILAPTFSIKNLNSFVKVFSSQSNTMKEHLKKAAGKGTFSLWKYLTTYTMDSVCETTLGIKVNSQLNPDHPFLEAFSNHCQMGSARVLWPPILQKLYAYLPAYEKYKRDIHFMHNFVDEVIRKKRITEFKKQSDDQYNITQDRSETSCLKTFMDLLIKSSGYTDVELREESLVLILAGTDTSAVGAAFTCLMLAMHQDVQEKVYDEILEIVKDSKEPIIAADLPKLKYLDVVIKETLRLYPPVPIISRQVDQQFQLASGVTIPKNTAVIVNIWAIHHNPEYWGEDVEQFRPERFLDSGLHPAAFMPFSNGPRSCLGYQYAMMSMKTAVATLVRHYHLLPTKETQAPLRVKYNVMMKHVHNFELQIENRL